MGLAYTVDTPAKVARYGIDSVVSIIEDQLIERMRQHYYKQTNRRFFPITPKDDDHRARRVTDYLNLMNSIVKSQVEKLRRSAFEAGSEITKYFEMLPGSSPLRVAYDGIVAAPDEPERRDRLEWLREQVRPGRIDVNIMTKVDKNNYDKKGNVLPESSDALAALRGYANSDLTNSSVVFSAGLNPRLFNYLEKFSAFHAKGVGVFDKEIVLKVSDYRSALIQGKFLAKKGVWVSEFRIESGLNCGGHAFATDGSLLGPILEEFKSKKDELMATLFHLYKRASDEKGLAVFDEPHPIRITVQGGIGTSDEARFLQSYYNVDRTGWGTPFLLCPEATTVDEHTLRLLSQAGENDIVLSNASPLGVRFNYLKGTTAEKERLARIAKGKPGSPCTEKHLVSNTEFTKEPICTASHAYQKQKIEQLQALDLPPDVYAKQYADIVSKECLCIGLSNAAILSYGLPPVKRLEAVTICPGPNLAYYDKIVTLKEMTDHIYGRTNLIARNDRPHMFIKELWLNIRYLKEQAARAENDKAVKEQILFGNNLLHGIQYYRTLLPDLPCDRIRFAEQLAHGERELNNLVSGMEMALRFGVAD